jgi:ankyrin repeat protein
MLSHRSRLVLIALLATILAVVTTAQDNASDALYIAIRTNNLARLEAMTADRASVDAKDDRGITPLMYAAWVGSPEAMKLLLERGADPNLTNSNGSTALMMSVTELAKVKMLLARGADVNKATPRGRTALLLAAMSPRSAEVVKGLIAAGADVKAVDAFKTTALIAATLGNDTETIRVLLDAGLDVNAADFPGATPLINASSAGNLDIVRLLLAKGANVNAAMSNGSFQKVKAGTIALGKFTALASAMPFGSFEVVKTLLDAGANVNAVDVRGMTPLMLAVATDRQNPEKIQALIAKGADVNVKSLAGETALDWARKTGSPAAVAALTKAGAVASVAPAVALPPFVPADLRMSAQRSIALLEASAVKAAANGGCASCHSHNITDVVTNLARAKGLRVDEKAAADRRQLTKAPYFAPLNLLERLDGPGSPDVPLYALGGLAAAGYPPDRITDAMIANVVSQQLPNGSWRSPHGAIARPPIEDGDFSRTGIAIRAMKVYGAPARADMPDRFARARDWLLNEQPATTEDRNMQLVGLECAGVDRAVLQRFAKAILATQRPDGGWGQRAEFQSDAYATGQTLYALASTGVITSRASAYQKGVKFLLSTQHGDGSWYVRSRSPKFQPYFDGGFPYAHDQWISSMATGWAAAALTLALDDPTKAAAAGVGNR